MWVGTFAQVQLARAANEPTLTSFTASVGVVDRNALTARTARVPVSWVTTNRPITSNLFFEQILPDGSTINVELPRIIPWVNSSGDGMAAPILPTGANEIRLRVRLSDLLTREVYSQREIVIPIGSAGGGSTTGNRPTITRFTSCCPQVRADQLAAGTARLPVTWEVINRPFGSTLIFEQITASGSAVNVELPRQNPWVNSSGDGVTAPQSAGTSAGEILLRVRLIDLLSGRVYDQRELIATISDTPTYDPQISVFSTTAVAVNPTALQQRTARIPVAWDVTNRPPSSNLVFEQVLADNSVVNIELPRSNPWVASAGSGVTAPVPPGGTATEIRFRLRLVDLTTNPNRTYVQREFTLPISGTAPTSAIRFFTTNSTGIAIPQLNAGTARVSVFWAVDNRPDNSNLVFEQVMPDGTAVNVELPRTNPIIPSEGAGVVAPRPQTGNQLRLRLRLVNLLNNSTIETRELTVPILNANVPDATTSGFQCLQSPFEPSSGITVGDRVVVTDEVENSGGQLNVLNAAAPVGTPIGSLSAGTIVTVLNGPACYRSESNHLRQWRISTGGQLEGWVSEYATFEGLPIFYLEVAEDDSEPQPVCDNIAFFGTIAGCVTAEGVGDGAVQLFENGFMLWVADTRQVFVMFNGGNGTVRVEQYTDASSFAEEQPPDGLVMPVRGFGWVWTQDLALRAQIGWATAPEQGYMVQTESATLTEGDTEVIYLDTPDGRAIQVTLGDGGGFSWEYVS
ncbi:MAG: hypothetical protein H7175_22815 [Burkholderiales bacterium]|nr:hypothetical protein [Anaerolineae bacterium]